MTSDVTSKDIGRLDKAVETLEDVAKELRINQQKNTDKFMDIFQSMNSNLIKLNSAMDNMTEKFEDHITEDEKIHFDNNFRIQSLEASRLRTVGYATGAGAVGSGVIAILSKVLFR